MKKVEIEFAEQSRAVVAKINITLEGENIDVAEAMAESKKLFDEAQKYALDRSFARNK